MTATLTIAVAMLATTVHCSGPDVTIVTPEHPAPRTSGQARVPVAPPTTPDAPAAAAPAPVVQAAPAPAAPAPAPPAPPASAPTAAPNATPAGAPAAALVVPPVIIDCATSAMSAKRLADLKVPYYPWFGQSADPESLKTGTINIGILLGEIHKRMGANPTGWGMLDFEDPFDAWLDLPVTDPRNRKASSEMVRAIKAVKAQFPNVKWTYYGQPRLARQFPDGKSWPNSTDAFKKAEIEHRIASCGDILREVDWIAPSIYDVYENALFTGGERDFMLANENIWREQVVQLARTIRERLGLPQVPVMPCVSLFFFENGRGTNMAPILLSEVLEDQIAPALRAGADGFAVWTSMEFFQQLATMPDDKELNQLNRANQTAARAAWTARFFGGKRPADWTAPEVKFAISQETGKVISDGAAAIVAEVQRARASKAPAVN